MTECNGQWSKEHERASRNIDVVAFAFALSPDNAPSTILYTRIHRAGWGAGTNLHPFHPTVTLITSSNEVVPCASFFIAHSLNVIIPSMRAAFVISVDGACETTSL